MNLEALAEDATFSEPIAELGSRYRRAGQRYGGHYISPYVEDVTERGKDLPLRVHNITGNMVEVEVPTERRIVPSLVMRSFGGERQSISAGKARGSRWDASVDQESQRRIAHALVREPAALETVLLLADAESVEIAELVDEVIPQDSIVETIAALRKRGLIGVQDRSISLSPLGRQTVDKLRA